MKYYNTEFIKNYIEEHQDEIAEVACGMKEDWGWTCDVVYSQIAGFFKGLNWKSKHIEVCGIRGSMWATPVMQVDFKNGETEIIECWDEDGKTASPYEIRQMKDFASATGGMDCIG